LHQVAGLNPATSHVIREWDNRGAHDWTVRTDFLAILKEGRSARNEKEHTVNRVADLAAV
jgi:hypothetical protein